MESVPLGADRLVGERYRLEAPVGRGGMGEVWRAQHVALKTQVAIKFLHGSSAASERSRRRFLTEAQVTATLKTRYAVQVFDFGVTDDGIPYLVMELLEGETLDRRLCRDGRLSIAATVAILSKAARALDRAHALGIVHRDFKPENIMLVHDDEEGGELVKVVDFGIAKLVGGLDHTLKSALSSLARARGAARAVPIVHTETHSGAGTPYYMAPEQVQDSAEVGPAADLWAFGVVAYECLTGQRPFEGDSLPVVLRRILSSERPRRASTRAPVPEAFDAWFERACAPDPDARFPDVQAAAAALAIALDVASSPASLLGPDTPMPLTMGGLRWGSPAAVLEGPLPQLPPPQTPLIALRAASPLAATLTPPNPPPSVRGSKVPREDAFTVPIARLTPLPSPPPAETSHDGATSGPRPARAPFASPGPRAPAESGRRRRSAVVAAVVLAIAPIAIAVRGGHDPSSPAPRVAPTAARFAMGPGESVLDDPSLERGPVGPAAVSSSATPVVEPAVASSQPSVAPPRPIPPRGVRGKSSAYRLPPLGL
jgi:serine/threonine-protein kinase